MLNTIIGTFHDRDRFDYYEKAQRAIALAYFCKNKKRQDAIIQEFELIFNTKVTLTRNSPEDITFHFSHSGNTIPWSIKELV